MNVDEIFNKMKTNLKKRNNMDFEARCLALFSKNTAQKTQLPTHMMIKDPGQAKSFLDKPRHQTKDDRI